MVPIFLGSSFAFIAPIVKATELYGLPGTLSGLVAVGAVYFLMSALVKWQGVNLIIVSLILTTGIGGAVLQVGTVNMTGIGLSVVIGVLLNLILPRTKEEKEMETNA